MKRFSWMCVAAALAVAFTEAPVRAGGLACAIDEALSSKNLLGTPVEAFKHQFTIQPVKEEKLGSKHILAGTIVHHGKKSPRDEVAYRVVKEKGAIAEAQFRINGGEWQALSAAMTTALGGHTKTEPMSDKERNAASAAMHKAAQGSWQNAVEFLIAQLGVRHC